MSQISNIEFTCNNTFIPPQCQGELYTECQYDRIRGSSLQEIRDNTLKVCALECGRQFERLNACLNTVGNQSDVQTVCRDMWNVRCSRMGDTYCYPQRLQNWINKGYTNGDDVNNAIKQNKNPGMPCTDCTRQMLKYEEEYDRFMLTKQEVFSWSRANGEIARQSCGSNFLGDYKVDTSVFSGVNDGQSVAGQSQALNWALIVGLSVASLVLLIAAIFAFAKYRKSQSNLFDPVRRRRSEMSGRSERLSEPIMNRNRKFESVYSDITTNSGSTDQYYVSQPM